MPRGRPKGAASPPRFPLSLSPIAGAAQRQPLKSLKEALWEGYHDLLLWLDAQRLEVIGAGRPLALTPTQHRLLVLLTANAGRTLTIAEIWEEVWGDLEPTPHLVKWHIRNLRQKLGEAGQRIRTVSGYGYRYDPPDPSED